MRLLVVVLKILVVLAVCMANGMLGSAAIVALSAAGVAWLGWVVALTLVVTVGHVLGDFIVL